MANTYTKIHFHCVFAVKFREAVISKSWQDRLHKYIIAIVNNNNHKLLCINSMPDHLHLLFGMRPHQSLSNLMQLVKGDSSEWINKERFVKGHFRWQEGYGAFTCGPMDVQNIVAYILNQENHHAKKSFRDEYREMLMQHEIEYDERYIFSDLE
jgi:putative transposase